MWWITLSMESALTRVCQPFQPCDLISVSQKTPHNPKWSGGLLSRASGRLNRLHKHESTLKMRLFLLMMYQEYRYLHTVSRLILTTPRVYTIEYTIFHNIFICCTHKHIHTSMKTPCESCDT